MNYEAHGKNGPDSSNSGMALGRCLVDGDPEAASHAHRTRGKTFGASLAIEISFVGLLVAAPLFSGVARPKFHENFPPQLTFLGGWKEHNSSRHMESPATVPRPMIPNPFQPIAPAATFVDSIRDEDPGFPAEDLIGEVVPGAIPVMEQGRALPPVEPSHIAQPGQQEKRPVKIVEGILEAQLISRIEPRYPPLALQLKQAGTVVLHAIISRDGRINALEVVSGSPFFVKAALDAVRQWRYRPTMLNGEPVEVETTITVVFRLQP
jgi:protein TonB